MKRALIATVVLAFGTALATASFAQGRHDEKPHGSTKPSAEQSQAAGPAMGGRHDERPHGTKKKTAPNKQATKSGEGTAPEAVKGGK